MCVRETGRGQGEREGGLRERARPHRYDLLWLGFYLFYARFQFHFVRSKFFPSHCQPLRLSPLHLLIMQRLQNINKNAVSEAHNVQGKEVGEGG